MLRAIVRRGFWSGNRISFPTKQILTSLIDVSGGTELQRPLVLLCVTLCSGHESNQKYCAMVVDGVGSLAVSFLVQSICRIVKKHSFCFCCCLRSVQWELFHVSRRVVVKKLGARTVA